MNKKIIFRADGNSKTGLGHLYRLFALVEMYRGNYDFIFVTKEDSVLEIIPSDYPIKIIPLNIPLEKEAKWLSEQFRVEDYLVIADGYSFISSYQKAMKDQGFILIYVDDLTTEYMYADIVVNHSLYVKESDFKAQSYTKFALGADYAMLRPHFLNEVKNECKPNKIDTAFVCFGGADPYDLSLKATQALLQFSEFVEINIVLGGAYKHKDIFVLAKQNKNIKLHSNLNEKNLCDLMKRCNLAIAPCSTISYELCCVGINLIAGYFVENQLNIYKGFKHYNILFDGADFEHKNSLDFKELIQEVVKSVDSRKLKKINNQYKLFNKNQKEAFLVLIANI